MAIDYTELDPGSGGDKIAGDSDGTGLFQYIKVVYGADGTQTLVTSSVGLPVNLLAGTAGIGKLTAGSAEIGSVKWAGTAPPIGAGVEATALRVTMATDSTGVLSIDDNGGSITVDGTVTANPASGTIDTVTTVTAVTDITNTIDSTISGDALTALQKIDNIEHVDDAAFTLGTHSGVMIMGFAGTQSVDANDAGALAMETDGALHIHDGGNSITIDGTVTANLSATDNAVLDQIEVNTSYGDNTGGGTESGALRVTMASDSTGVLSIDDNGGSITVDGTVTANPASGTIDTVSTVTNLAQMNGAAITMGNGASGTGVQRVTIASDTTGVLSVDDNGGSLTVDNGGTFATQATLQTGSNTVGEVTLGTATTAATDLAKAQDVAVGASDVGMAMLVKRDDEQAAVTPADGDYVVPTCDKFGKLKVTELPDATSVVKYTSVALASSGDNTVQAAAGAGVKIRVLSVVLIASGTLTARFESGASGTALTGQMALVANSGFTLPYNPHGWFETADNALLNLELSDAVQVAGCITYVEV